MPATQALTHGAHHVGFTVPDLDATLNFFINTLGFKQVGSKPNYPAAFVSDGTLMLTLWQAVNPAKATPFDRKNNIGLHHFALKVETPEALQSIYETLKNTVGVDIEFAPEPLDDGPTQHMMFYIPGGIRMELIAR